MASPELAVLKFRTNKCRDRLVYGSWLIGDVTGSENCISGLIGTN